MPVSSARGPDREGQRLARLPAQHRDDGQRRREEQRGDRHHQLRNRARRGLHLTRSVDDLVRPPGRPGQQDRRDHPGGVHRDLRRPVWRLEVGDVGCEPQAHAPGERRVHRAARAPTQERAGDQRQQDRVRHRIGRPHRTDVGLDRLVGHDRVDRDRPEHQDAGDHDSRRVDGPTDPVASVGAAGAQQQPQRGAEQDVAGEPGRVGEGDVRREVGTTAPGSDSSGSVLSAPAARRPRRPTRPGRTAWPRSPWPRPAWRGPASPGPRAPSRP